MVKILFAIGRLSVGGGEKLLVREIQHIDRQTFDPYLLTLFLEQKESFEEMLRMSIPDSDQFFETRWKRMEFRGLFDVVSWFRLIQFFRKEKFDAVVTSLFSANLIVRFALLCAGVPHALVSYEHNIYADKRRWQIITDRFLARWTDAIFVDAESVKRFTAVQEHIPEEKFLVMYIPPLVDAVENNGAIAALRKEFGIAESTRVILTVSRLVPEKGHAVLIQAAKKVSAEFPNVRFVIVGWGSLKAELERLVVNAGLGHNVVLAGRRDIAEVLPLADAYVEPALSVDIGIASMEAMARGLPIISTDVGEMPVFVKDGENGFLVPPGDSGALAEKVLLLLRDEVLRKKMSEASALRMKAFSLDAYMNRFENLILGIAVKKKNI